MRPVFTFEWAEEIGRRYGVETPFILGIRGFLNPDDNSRTCYDDCLAVVDLVTFETFNGNTDPSKFQRGIASVVAPQVIPYKIGTHNISKEKAKQYQALVQAGPIEVTRDGEEGTFKGMFGINIHRGGVSTPGSEGCQTIPPEQWSEFMATVWKTLKMRQIYTINYLLIDAKDAGL